jgi:hypothetical protein
MARQASAPSCRPLLPAPIKGAAAWLLVQFLDGPADETHTVSRLEAYAARLAAGVAHPRYVADLWEARGLLAEAARQWHERRPVSDEGSAEGVVAEIGGSSLGEISTDRAAGMLGVSARRVRQLVAGGVLTGRLVGRVWLVDAGSVETLRAVREGGEAA